MDPRDLTFASRVYMNEAPALTSLFFGWSNLLRVALGHLHERGPPLSTEPCPSELQFLIPTFGQDEFVGMENENQKMEMVNPRFFETKLLPAHLLTGVQISYPHDIKDEFLYS